MDHDDNEEVSAEVLVSKKSSKSSESSPKSIVYAPQISSDVEKVQELPKKTSTSLDKIKVKVVTKKIVKSNSFIKIAGSNPTSLPAKTSKTLHL